MQIYDYEAAFGAADKTTRAMRNAVKNWFSMYYEHQATREQDPCQRIAYTVVSKLGKTVFGEYSTQAADPVAQRWLAALEEKKQAAMQLALVGGECYIKPCPLGAGFSFTLIPRDRVLVFGRDERGEVTDMGTAERWTEGKYYYTLLERRSLDRDGLLNMENKLFRSLNAQSLGSQVSLKSVSRYAQLPEKFRFPEPMDGIGLVRLKTPILNCVDGSGDGVAVFAPAVGLIRTIDENEAQLSGEFKRGQSRVILSADMLRDGALQDDLFVGLDEDPDRLGITVFAPQLREQSYLARKQEILRNIESVIGLKRGMLSNANMDERTATEIAASAADYNLTVMDFQQMWERSLHKTMALCAVLARLYGLPMPQDSAVTVDWGNGVLYDEEKTWAGYLQMVKEGLLKPEIALGWRFGMPVRTEGELAAVRQTYMP